MVKIYGRDIAVYSGQENTGHADVVIKYSTYRNHYSGITWLHPTLGCSAQENISVERCSICSNKELQPCTSCLYDIFCLSGESKCTFLYITASASKAVLMLTGENTDGIPGTQCYVFGKYATIIEDKQGGTYELSPLVLLPLSL